jgi:transforming growth factor-beta-induced protein
LARVKYLVLFLFTTIVSIVACQDVNQSLEKSPQMPIKQELIEQTKPSSEQSNDQLMGKTILQVLQTEGRYNIFLRMLTQTNMQDVLNETGPITLFVPSDDAFENMDATKKSDIESNEKSMKRFLEHHLYRGLLKSEDFKFGPIKMVSGSEAMLVPFSGGAMIGDSVLLESDLQTKNGMIHKIDKPLAPPNS